MPSRRNAILATAALSGCAVEFQENEVTQVPYDHATKEVTTTIAKHGKVFKFTGRGKTWAEAWADTHQSVQEFMAIDDWGGGGP